MPMKLLGERIKATVAGFREFTLAEFRWLVSQGFFGQERLELLDGCLVEKPAADPIHESTLQRATKRFFRLVPAGWEVRVQMAYTLIKSEPLPDLAVVREVPDEYASRHPGPDDTALLVEVSNTSLEYDREDKGRVYAQGGVAVYWVVDVNGKTVEVYEQPSGPTADPGYGAVTVYKPGDAVPLVIGGVDLGPIPVNELIR